MQNLNLTVKELIQHLDLYNTDPYVRRLLELVASGEELIVDGLIEVGMDPMTYEFDDNWEHRSPADLIRHLRNEVDYYEREAAEWEEKYNDMKDERDGLKARSVANLLSEMREQVKRAESARDEASRRAQNYQAENAELTEKINVWTIMER